MTLLKDAIRAANAERKQQEGASAESTESSKAVNTASSKAVNIENDQAITPSETAPDEIVALTIKVPKSQRVHWLIEAKKEGTTLTAAITTALNTRFGEAKE